MRHYKRGRKLGTDWSHTKAMKRSLVTSLLENDRIKTVEARAKEIRPDVDKIITWAKRGDLHSRRLAIAALGGNKELVREVFEKVKQGMFKDRPGGYTRIMKLGYRKGDGASMVIIELVTEPVRKKVTEKKATPKKTEPKKVEAASAEILDVTAETTEEVAADTEEADTTADESEESADKNDAAKSVEAKASDEVEESTKDEAEAVEAVAEGTKTE